MGTRDETLRVNVKVDGDKDLDKLADRVGDVGDEFDKTGKKASRLDTEVEDLRKSIKGLNAEYEKGGDAKVLKQIEAQQRELRRIESIKRNINKLDGDRAKTLEKIVKLSRDEEARVRKTRSGGGGGGGGGGLLGAILGAGGSGAGALAGGVGTLGKMVPDGGVIGDVLKAYVASIAIPTLVPVAMAGAGGAIGAGAAAGGIGAGVLGAFKGPDGDLLEQRYGRVIDNIEKRWISASRSFTRPLLDAADAFDKVGENFPLEKALKLSSEYVDDIADGLAGLVGNSGGGFVNLLGKAQPIIEELADELPELGEDISFLFDSIGDGAEGGADAIGDILDIVGVGIRLTGLWIEAFEKLYGGIHDSLAGDAIRWLGSFFDKPVPESFGKSLDTNVTEPLKEGEEAAKAQQKALDDLFGTWMSVDEANLKVKESWLDLNEELRDGKRSLDDNTAAGQSNIGMIQQHIQNLEAQRQKNIAAGESQATANQKFNEGVAAIKALLTQLGFAPGEIQALIDKWMALYNTPNISKTATFTNIYRYYYENGTPKQGNSRYGGDNYAEGGPVGYSGLKLVGERGPELVELSAGDYVHTAAETRQMMSGASGGMSMIGGGRMMQPIILQINGREIVNAIVETAADRGQTTGHLLGIR